MRIRIISLIHRVPTTKLSAKRIVLRRTGRIFASFFYYKPGNSDCVLYSLKMNGFAVHAVFPETEQRKIMIAHISRIWIFSSLLFFAEVVAKCVRMQIGSSFDRRSVPRSDAVELGPGPKSLPARLCISSLFSTLPQSLLFFRQNFELMRAEN